MSCSVLQCCAVFWRWGWYGQRIKYLLQCVAARRSVLQCIAVCCSVLQCAAVSGVLGVWWAWSAHLVSILWLWLQLQLHSLFCLEPGQLHWIQNDTYCGFQPHHLFFLDCVMQLYLIHIDNEAPQHIGIHTHKTQHKTNTHTHTHRHTHAHTRDKLFVFHVPLHYQHLVRILSVPTTCDNSKLGTTTKSCLAQRHFHAAGLCVLQCPVWCLRLGFLATYWVPGAIGHLILRPEDPILTESQVCPQHATPSLVLSPKMEKSHFKHHKRVDFLHFSIVR